MLLRKGRLFLSSLRCDSVQKWPEIGKLVPNSTRITPWIAKLAATRLFLDLAAGAFGRWIGDFDFGLFRQDRFCYTVADQRAGMEITWIGLSSI